MNKQIKRYTRLLWGNFFKKPIRMDPGMQQTHEHHLLIPLPSCRCWGGQRAESAPAMPTGRVEAPGAAGHRKRVQV